eukprot:s1275_g2.t1
MSSDTPERVAENLATAETPGEGAEVAATAEEAIQSWADASEEVPAPELTSADIDVEVKDEEAAAQESLDRVLQTIGISEEVADEPVATEAASSSHLSGLEFLQPPTEDTETEVPAVAAFADLDQTKEETKAPSTPSEEVPAEAFEVETTDLLGLGEEPSVGAETAVEASEPIASVPEPLVADSVATDPTDIAAPPTSPNLVPPGVEPLQTGHTPASGSRPPREPPPDPEDPNDPQDPEEEEGEWVEEEEEEEPQEEDQVLEEEAELSSPQQEPEFPDFSSPRSRQPQVCPVAASSFSLLFLDTLKLE